MLATPFGQVAVAAVAVKCTGELTVLPFAGEVTKTPVCPDTVIGTMVKLAPPQ
jgi:hypothetical protein